MKSLKNTISEFAHFLGRKNSIALTLSIGLGFCWFLIEVSFIFVIQIFLASINLIDHSSVFLNQWITPTIPLATLLLVLFTLVRGFIWAVRQYYCVALAQTFVTEKRTFLLENSIKNSSSVSNHLLLKAFSESTIQSGTFIQNLVLVCVVTLTIVLFSAYSLYTAPKEFLTSFIILGVFAVYIKKYDKKLSALAHKIDHEKSVSTHVIVDGIRNNFFIKISGRINDEIKKGQKSLNNFDDHFKNYYLITAIRSALPMFLGGTVIAITFYLSLNYFGTNTTHLLLFFYLLIRLTQSVTELANYLTEVQLHLPGFNSLREICNKLNSNPSNYTNQSIHIQNTQTSFKPITQIEAKKLSFSYTGVDMIMQDLSFKLQKGESLLIKGSSGKGKSTLLALIVGLLKPSHGSVLINNENSIDNFASISNKTGYVGPDSYFISGSLRENLLYGHPTPDSVSDDQIWGKLEAVNLVKEVKALQNQLLYHVNADLPFSTGQKQRLSIARALLRNPDILLLDESTANLDQQTESEIIQYLKNVASNFIIIIVSHKAGFDKFANHTINM